MASPSTRHIDIDWSTPSSSSFVRLGEQLPSQEDPDSINTAPPVLTTTKDILSLDIDDILNYRESDIGFTVYTDVETPEEVITPEDKIPLMVTPLEDVIPSTVTFIDEDIPSLAPHIDDDKISVTTNKNTLHIVTPPVNNSPLKENTFSFLISFEKFHVTKSHRTGTVQQADCPTADFKYPSASRTFFPYKELFPNEFKINIST
ncbi:hypothetical protein C1646_765154 [Rhizophagus diaphanus]|nr:hypothetical protein C1646_765154 [Rhizophagus diaphanus] [Rhizophagus sp. MUCL 43196]